MTRRLRAEEERLGEVPNLTQSQPTGGCSQPPVLSIPKQAQAWPHMSRNGRVFLTPEKLGAVPAGGRTIPLTALQGHGGVHTWQASVAHTLGLPEALSSPTVPPGHPPSAPLAWGEQ